MAENDLLAFKIHIAVLDIPTGTRSTTAIHKKIDDHVGFDPIRIKNDVGPELTTIIAEQKDLYPGVVIEVLPIREYIYHEQGAHAFGYVSEISDAELEKKKALDEMKQEMITIASMMAGKAVAASMDVKIQDELIEKTLKEIGDDTWQS